MDSWGEHCEMHLISFISSLLRTAPNFLCKRWRTRLLRWESLFLITHYSWAVDQKKARLQELNGSLKSTQNNNGGKVTEHSSHQHNVYYYVQKVYFQSTLSAANCWREIQKKVQGVGRNKPHQTPYCDGYLDHFAMPKVEGRPLAFPNLL